MNEAARAAVTPFLGRIAFTFSPEKGRSCIDWIRRLQPDISWDGVVTTMLCAEALHLGRYGRPVTGASYSFDGAPASADLAGSVLAPVASVGTQGLPDNMSRSDAEAIEDVCRNLRELGVDGLIVRASAWRHGSSADYALMVDAERPHAEELLSDLACFGRHFAF